MQRWLKTSGTTVVSLDVRPAATPAEPAGVRPPRAARPAHPTPHEWGVRTTSVFSLGIY